MQGIEIANPPDFRGDQPALRIARLGGDVGMLDMFGGRFDFSGSAEGLQIRRTYALARGSYALRVRDELVNTGTVPWSGQVARQLLRNPPPAKGGFTNPEAFKRFQEAQASLTSALSRLLAVVENYPQLQSIQAYRDLQAQLEGIENRITVARKRYIESVQGYNTTVRSFPTNLTAMMFGFKVKPNFSVENEAEISKPPTVDFGTDTPPATEPPATEPTS